MKIKLWIGVLVYGVLQSAAADSTIERAQTALKEQGFYYGAVSGEKNADTTAAIRRFQIRNGLQVTGELNQETLSALNGARSGGVTIPATTPAPRAVVKSATPPPASANAYPQVPPATAPVLPQSPTNSSAVLSPVVNAFKNTPYASAPPALQSRVLLLAQSSLRRRGYYRGSLDGTYNPVLQFSLRAYQSNSGLQPSGRLDLQTLSSLGLLPGPRGPVLVAPARGFPPQPLSQAPVRGEWIHERGDD